MSKLKNYNLGFFFTEGASLDIWDKVGMLSREIEPYNILADYFNKIFFFTYGDYQELHFKKYLKSNIEIIYRKNNVNSKMYSYILPVINKKVIQKCRFLKTNQMKGAQAAYISKKIINQKAKLIVRSGYTWSLFAKKQNQSVYFIEFLEKNIYKFCDKAIVSSEGDKKYLLEKYKFSSDKISLIPNYINTDNFKIVEKQKQNFKRIIYIGRLEEQKNLFNLINALCDTNITLDIVGSGSLENKLKKNAYELNVKINFLGNISNHNLPEILNNHRIFVLPSLYEGMPKTLMEAMSCGLACVATDVNGSRELIRNNETGLLAQTDSGSLRKNILKLINNEELQSQLGRNARQFIVDNYSLCNLIKKEINIYEDLA